MTVQELEQRALALRMELSKLASEYQDEPERINGDDPRMERIRVDLEAARVQLSELTGEPDPEFARSVGNAVGDAVRQRPRHRGLSSGNIPQGRPVVSSVKPRRRGKDMERFVGQSVMGVLASLLVFIGMAVFAALVLPALPVSARMLILYLVSGAVLAFGLRMMWRDPGSLVGKTVSGFGVGAIYVCIMASDVVWLVQLGMAGDVLTYVLLLAWAACMCRLSKRLDGPFEIIGHVGITVASLFGFMKSCSVSDEVMAMLVVLFFVVAEACYVASYHGRKRPFHPSCASVLVTGFAFWGIYECDWADMSLVNPHYSVAPFLGARILMGLVLIAFTGYHVWALPNTEADDETYDVSRGNLWRDGAFPRILQEIICIGTLSVSYFMLDGFDMFPGFLFAALACLYMVRHDEVAPAVFPSLATVLAFFGFHPYLYSTELNVLVVMPLAYLAMGTRSRGARYVSMGMMFTYLFVAGGYGQYADAVKCGLVTLCALELFYLAERSDSGMFRALAYLFRACALYYVTYRVVEFLFPMQDDGRFMLFPMWDVVASMCATGLVFLYNIWEERRSGGGRAMGAACGIVNLLAMAASTALLLAAQRWPLVHMCAVVLMVACFARNSRQLLDYRFGGCYVGLKFLFLCWCILESYSVVNFAVSIAFFVLACVSVAVGFWFRNKGLRVFGLVLSFVSVCKLVLFDITYDSSAFKAFSFVLCGLLCFVINVIYSMVGRLQEKDDGNPDAPD